MSIRPISLEPSSSEQPTMDGSDMTASELASSPLLESSATEWQPARKRVRSDTSEDEGEADAVQPKPPQVRRRIERNQRVRLLAF